MANPYVFECSSLTGGVDGSLDSLNTTSLADASHAKVDTGSIVYTYVFSSASSATEKSPEIIAPDTGTGRWLLSSAISNSGFGVYSYPNLSTPPPLTTQYSQFTYGADLYFRKAVDNQAVSWSYGAYDQTLKFLQLSTAGDDKDNLNDTVTPDIPFSTYWSKVYAGGTISRESDYFKISLPANSGEARLQSFRFDNDVDPYVFDNATCPITFNFDMKFPSTVMGDSFNSVCITSKTPIHSYLCALTFDILRDSAGAASGYKVRVTGISNGFGIVIINYKINSTVTVPVDTDCVISFYIDGTAWQIFVDGSEIFNSTETGLENDDTTPVSMVLQDDFNLWRNENLRVGIGATVSAGTGTNTVYFKGLTIIPTE